MRNSGKLSRWNAPPDTAAFSLAVEQINFAGRAIERRNENRFSRRDLAIVFHGRGIDLAVIGKARDAAAPLIANARLVVDKNETKKEKE